MMNEKLRSVISTVLFLILTISGGVLGSQLEPLMFTQEGIPNIEQDNIDDILKDCGTSQRIDGILECVMIYIQPRFRYLIRDDAEDVGMTTLLIEGGDCRNWAQFWSYVGKYYGYNSQEITIDVDKYTSHRFTILSNDEGYCKLDQNKIDCFVYGG